MAAVAGAIIVLIDLIKLPYHQVALIVGGLLVLGGLLLRIEGAIWASKEGGDTPPDHAGDR